MRHTGCLFTKLHSAVFTKLHSYAKAGELLSTGGTIASPRSSGSRHPCAGTECVLSLLKCQASFKGVLLYCYFLSQKTLRCEPKGVIPPPSLTAGLPRVLVPRNEWAHYAGH